MPEIASGARRISMDEQEIMQRFQPLWADLRPEDTFAAKKPLLAHASNEVWFSISFL
jgi:hypothetical protein